MMLVYGLLLEIMVGWAVCLLIRKRSAGWSANDFNVQSYMSAYYQHSYPQKVWVTMLCAE
ncbi:hypothetical protein A9Q99_02100 [Gammaproteobacteria bacterium 45_16_T64]|nr:hypothetical protein A9Q99_02100 [Gammaproteobacteria bacterium 45_16_T64]